jgi:hypothetical protein
MSSASEVQPAAREGERERIRSTFREVFVPAALAGLPRMLVEDGRWFSFKAFAGDLPDALRNEGRSERYSAMVLIGLERQRALGRSDAVPTERVVESLAAWAPDAPVLGDAGLVLWIHVMRGDARAEPLARRIVARQAELSRPAFGFASMDMGCLLLGLGEALRAGCEVEGQRALADEVARRLALQQDPGSQLFSFARRVRRKNLHRVRLDTRLGSFASQVYPTMGFAAHARATGDPRSAAIARGCAERICSLQGDRGQWWWIYNVRGGRAAVRYPVYAVHQDAMGPMMLCAAALAAGDDPRFHRAIDRSLGWFEQRPELPDRALVDPARGVVWRAVQHDDPSRTERLGLGRGELRRMGRSAWLGAADTRICRDGHVCPECRSYHLGWILLADAMYEEVCDLAPRS